MALQVPMLLARFPFWRLPFWVSRILLDTPVILSIPIYNPYPCVHPIDMPWISHSYPIFHHFSGSTNGFLCWITTKSPYVHHVSSKHGLLPAESWRQVASSCGSSATLVSKRPELPDASPWSTSWQFELCIFNHIYILYILDVIYIYIIICII